MEPGSSALQASSLPSELQGMFNKYIYGFPSGTVIDTRDVGLFLGTEESLEEEMAIHPVILPGKSHG